MNKPKYTPGPWRKVTETTGDGRVIRREVYGPEGCGRGGKPIAFIPHGFTGNDANHDLIWAAPDLLAACEVLIVATTDGDARQREIDLAIRAGLAAIAKAIGGPSC